MKRTLLTILLAVATICVWAQEPCGTMTHLHWLEEHRPEAARSIHRTMEETIARDQEGRVRPLGVDPRSGSVITIPVVVHVVYNSPTQNISDAQILSQIDVLNQDFRRQNADTSNTPAAFAGIMADAEIEFCMARRDPNGDPTTGIIRKATNIGSFSMLDNMKFDQTGGSDAWPRDQYLNIWVCNLNQGLSGYAQFPGGPANTDGIVVDYANFGTLNTTPPLDKGRIATHEVGHWLGLSHVWGDDNNACTGSDNIADTPNQADYSIGCPIFPLLDACSPSNPGVMFMNYMDYSDDACMNGFTQGQVNRMQGVLANTRSTIPNSNGCVLPSLLPNNAALGIFLAPLPTSCADPVTPEFELTNLGADTLTDLTLHWQIDQGAVQSQLWTGNLPLLTTTAVTLPPMSLNPGTHDLLVYATDPNGYPDGDPSNDTIGISFDIQPAPGNQPVPFMETFESSGNIPPGWEIYNPDLDETWSRTPFAGANNSSASFWISLFYYQSINEEDGLITPPFDFSTAPAPVLTFDLSYRRRTIFSSGDTLKVQVSTDCGITWQTEYANYGFAMATVLPNFSAIPWQPGSASEWRTEVVDLSAYAGMQGVRVRFLCINGGEQNIYLDNIGVMPMVGVEVAGSAPFEVVPNPSSGNFRVIIPLAYPSNVKVECLNSLGQIIRSEERVGEKMGSLEVPVDLSEEAPGVYFVQVTTSEGRRLKKVIKVN